MNDFKLLKFQRPDRAYSVEEYVEMEELMMEWLSDCHKYRKRWVITMKFIAVIICFTMIGIFL